MTSVSVVCVPQGRLGEFRAAGHLEAAAVWVRIIDAIEAMRAGAGTTSST